MNLERKTIFLVDDDPTNLMLGRSLLSEQYDVLTLSSGKKLLKALENKIPHLILLDVDMPEMDGYDTIEAVKSNEKTAAIPVIFLTAKNDIDSELKGLSLGAVDYIMKPFSVPRLLKRIEMHMLVELQRRELLAQRQQLIEFSNNLQELVEEKTKAVSELQCAILKTMAELVDGRDDITGGHIERTTRYLDILLEAMAQRDLYAEKIASWNNKLMLQSAQLYDVGKIGVKDCILKKPARLTPEEFEEIKRHTVFGGTVIEKIKSSTKEQAFLEHAKVFAISHHEKWDGSGYPMGLKGEEIPLEGRLMAIADVYDALVSDRPYKSAYSHEEAVKIIVDGRGTHFDPNLTDLFVKVSDKFREVLIKFNNMDAG